ncbi:MAG: bifunctional riboflavin kinase/FAD synthetase [Oscillospiraceae bacterium]
MICITENDSICQHKTAVALGIFDGVHLGHQKVIKQAVEYSEKDIKPAVFTFNTDSVDYKGSGRLEMLLTNKDKLEKLSEMGIEYVYSPEFSMLKDMSAEDFVRKVLKEKLNACCAVCGDDFRFGKNASADVKLLKKIGRKYGIEVFAVDKLSVDHKFISSTEIRKYIKEGKISKANRMLGYNYGYNLTVEHGYERGRTWNFPTINQTIPENLVLPKFGVYCSKAIIDGREYMGVTNIGVKPTVEVDTKPLAETYIIDYEGDLYGQKIKLELCEFVRPERKFDSFEELRAEIQRNTEFTVNYFKSK